MIIYKHDILFLNKSMQYGLTNIIIIFRNISMQSMKFILVEFILKHNCLTS
jgi:hypothetical protein